MKVLVMDKFTNSIEIENATFIPQIGMKIDMGYSPHPTVVDVLLYPRNKRLKGYDAVVTCE